MSVVLVCGCCKRFFGCLSMWSVEVCHAGMCHVLFLRFAVLCAAADPQTLFVDTFCGLRQVFQGCGAVCMQLLLLLLSWHASCVLCRLAMLQCSQCRHAASIAFATIAAGERKPLSGCLMTLLQLRGVVWREGPPLSNPGCWVAGVIVLQ